MNELFDDPRAGKIYRTAARMIYENGFDATSMQAIAEAVQLTKPGLYYYVGRKKELLFSIMSFAMHVLESQVVRPAEGIPDPEERLRHIVAEHARLLTEDSGELAILMDEVGGLSQEQREQIITRKRHYFEFVRRTLDDLADQGRLQPVDTTVAAFSLLGMVMWTSRWYTKGGRLTGRDVVREMTEIATVGLLKTTSQVNAVDCVLHEVRESV